MKLLVLCDVVPFPLEHGFNLRVFFLSKFLAKKHQVDLLCFSGNTVPSIISETFNKVITFPPPKIVPPKSFIAKISESVSWDSVIPSSSEVNFYLQQVFNNKEYDAVLAYTYMLPSISFPVDIPIIADLVDDSVLEFWRELKAPNKLRKKITQLKWLIFGYFFEKKYFPLVDATITVSEQDAAFFSKVVPNCPIHIVQNGVDSEFFKPVYDAEDNQLLVFEGKMDFTVNADGVFYFVNEIFPLIKRTHPNTKFLVVGKNPSPDLLKLKSEFIEITGFVDDIRPYIAKATIFVCPLRKGAGIKNKLLQAWSLGKATVVTSVSTGGLIVNEGENVLVRDDPVEFAKAVTDLLDNKVLRNRLGENARITIEKNYSWQQKTSQLEDLFEKLINQKSS
jgi:glycosyltransferase involved in cell wall biosynthesis